MTADRNDLISAQHLADRAYGELLSGEIDQARETLKDLHREIVAALDRKTPLLKCPTCGGFARVTLAEMRAYADRHICETTGKHSAALIAVARKLTEEKTDGQ